MTKNMMKLFTISAIMIALTALASLATCSAKANAVGNPVGDNHGLLPPVVGPRPLSAVDRATLTRLPAAPAPGKAALLDARHRFALGMIETANNDREVGGAGEVSRFQIMPSVWKHYSDSRNYQNSAVSWEVAQRHWSVLHEAFKKQVRRDPTDFDMYVLWNTRYGYYASKGFNPARLNPVIRDRAQRFVNLLEQGGNS
jgi:hypothetical protein